MGPAFVAALEILAIGIGLPPRSVDQITVSPAVRAADDDVRTAMTLGCQRSQLFRSLGARIGELGGIVQIEGGRCATRRACLLHWVVASGPTRFLRIRIDTRLRERELIVLIGHELQHAVEVLSNPSIDTAEEIYWSFRGTSEGRSFETAAALQAEAQIRAQLKEAAVDVSSGGCESFASTSPPREVRH